MAQIKPNFLLLVTDQERYDMVGANGSSICRTPHLDRLAQNGITFKQAYTVIGICTPARASLLTGLYPHAHGLLNNCHGDDALRTELGPEHLTFSEILRDCGYRLGYIGKWHVGRHLGPQSRGFHDVIGSTYDIAAAEDEPMVLHPEVATFPHKDMIISGVNPLPLEETPTHQMAQSAIGLLHQYAENNQPFLLRVDFPGPHHPYDPPEPYASLYDPKMIPPWPSYSESLLDKPAAQHRSLIQRGVQSWTWSTWQRIIAHYYGVMTFIDWEIGRILDTLKQLGLENTTVVAHLSDHGDMTGAHGGQFNKGPFMYDEIYHIPLIVRYPGWGPTSRQITSFVRSMDLMPTILEIAEAPVPSTVQAKSLVPLLTGQADHFLNDIYAEYHGEEWGLFSQRMLRTAHHKLVYNPHSRDELYDLKQDPFEMVNQIDQPAYNATRQMMEQRLLVWMEETRDPLYRWASRVLGG